MIRIYILPVLAGLLGAAGPAGLPVPPIPPVHPPTGDSAPVPNLAVQAPSVVASRAPEVSLQPFRFNNFDASHGFTPGSRYRGTDDRTPFQPPSVTVSVPLR